MGKLTNSGVRRSRRKASSHGQAIGGRAPATERRDPHYIPMREAIEQAGLATYSEHWLTAEEARYDEMPIPAFDEVIDVGTAERVADILIEAGSDLVPPGENWGDVEWAENHEAWSAASVIIEARRRRSEQALMARRLIEERLLRRFRDGSIETYRGNTFQPVSPAEWHNKAWFAWLKHGSFEDGSSDDGAWEVTERGEEISVSRLQLNVHFPAQASEALLADMWEVLSPKLRLAIHVAYLIRDEEPEPSKEALIARMQTMAGERGFSLSQGIAEAFTTVIRSAKAAKGGRKKT